MTTAAPADWTAARRGCTVRAMSIRVVLGEIAQGKSNIAIAGSLFLSKRAVEKHINSIFLKLGLADAEDVSKRVKAALILLADGAAAAPPRV